MTLATGLFLEGKVGHIEQEELKEAEGRAENWLEHDLRGPSRRDKKSFFLLLRRERGVSERAVKALFPL